MTSPDKFKFGPDWLEITLNDDDIKKINDGEIVSDDSQGIIVTVAKNKLRGPDGGIKK